MATKFFLTPRETIAPNPIKNAKTFHFRLCIAAVLQAHAFDKLTGQEPRTAELILRGYSYTEIARTLEIKPGTVKTYWLSIYSKLQINLKRELFA